MKERYAFRYNEFLQQKIQSDKVFLCKENSNPLLADVKARFCGLDFIQGKSNLAKLGIQIKGVFENFQKLLPLTDVYGADAVRIALVEEMPLTDENLTGCWRFIGNFWCALQNKKRNKKTPFDIYKNLQLQNYKQAFITLKSLIKSEELCDDILMLSYPFMPHLILSFCPNIHEQMPLFWEKVQNMTLPDKLFIEINGKKVMDFYTNNHKEEDIVQESLSFDKIQVKIGKKLVKRIVFIPKKGVNFVI